MTLQQATAAQQSMGSAAIDGDNDDSVVTLGPREILLTWIGTVCERGFTFSMLTNDGGVVITPDPRPGCDTGRVVYAVVMSRPSIPDTDAFTIELQRPLIIDP